MKANQKRDIQKLVAYQANPGSSLGIDLQNPPRSHFLLRNVNFENVTPPSVLTNLAEPNAANQNRNAQVRPRNGGTQQALAAIPEHQRPPLDFINVNQPQQNKQTMLPNMKIKDVLQFIPAPAQPYRPLRAFDQEPVPLLGVAPADIPINVTHPDQEL